MSRKPEYLFLILLFFCFFIRVFPQENKSADTSVVQLPSFFSFSTDYSGNTNTFGRFNSLTTQPNYSLSAAYYGKKGVFAMANGLMVGNSDSTNSKATYELDLVVGYNFKFLKYFSFSPSYTMFLYSRNNVALISSYTGYLQTNLSFIYKKINASFAAGRTFGTYKEPILQFSLSVPFEFKNVFFKNHFVVIQPTLDISMGNQDYYNTFAYSNLKFLLGYTSLYPHADFSDFFDFISREQGPPMTDFYRNWKRFYPNGTFNDFQNFLDEKNITKETLSAYRTIARNRILTNHTVYNWLSNQNSKSPEQEINDVFMAHNNFNFNSFGIVLPIYYSVSDFIISLSFSGYKPLNTPHYLNDKWVFYFSAGVSYDIFIKKI